MTHPAGISTENHVKRHPESPQWYQTDPALFQAEIRAMRKELKQPDLQPQFMSDGRMYWLVKFGPNPNSDNLTREYTLALIYNNDHPAARHGCPVKPYLTEPTVQQLQKEMNRIPALSDMSLPHTVRDASGHIYLDTSSATDIHDGFNISVISAAAILRRAYRWLVMYESALRDPEGDGKAFFGRDIL